MDGLYNQWSLRSYGEENIASDAKLSDYSGITLLV